MTIFPEFSIQKCVCQRPFQRERFHKHHQGFCNEEQSYHRHTDFALYCPSWDKRASDKEALRDHSRYTYVSLSKAHMKFVLKDEARPNLAVVIAKAAENKAKASLRAQRDPIVAAVSASEMDQAILAITLQSANAATGGRKQQQRQRNRSSSYKRR